MKQKGKFQHREPDEPELLAEIRDQVEKEWLYWRPIAYGLVKLDKEDYDREGPRLLLKLNAAMDYMAKLESRSPAEEMETDYDYDF